MSPRGSHETYDRDDRTRMGSERGFGLVFAVVFTIVGVAKLWFGHALVGWAGGWLLLALAVLGVALAQPAWLRPFNRVWFRFGLLLHHVISPLVMGAVFFLTVTPVGLVMRALGKRPLRLAFDPAADSYWVERRPPGPPPGSFTNQY